MELLNKYKINIKNNEIEKIKKEIFIKTIAFLDEHVEIREQLKNIFQVKNDENYKKIISNYLSDIWLYINDIKYCLKCKEADFFDCNKPQPHYRHYEINLEFNGHYVFQMLSPCKWKKKFDEKNKPYIFDDLAYLGPFRDFPLTMFSLKEENELTIHNWDDSRNRYPLLKKCYEMLKEQQMGGIFIYGNFSSGKTYVSIAILNSFLKSLEVKKSVSAFLNFPERINYLQKIFFDDQNEFRKLMDLYSNVYFMVFDNFGDEFKSEFIRDRIVWPILLSRSKKNLLTIINSHFNYEDIARMYSFGKNGIEGAKFKELLLKMCGQPFDISAKKYKNNKIIS